MFLNLRPSKVVYARHLRKYMAKAEPYSTVLDCACANGKNRYFFPGKIYHGLDFNSERIAFARERYATDPCCHFYHDDMVNPVSHVREHQFDLVVSTHTLAHIAVDEKQAAVENMVALTVGGGSLIIQANRVDQPSLQSIQAEFETVHIAHYRGRSSRWFEQALERFFRAPLSVAAFRDGERGGIYRRTKYLLYALSFMFALFDGFGYRDRLILLGFRKR